MLDRKAYAKMDYSLCLLSAQAGGKSGGCIVNSFHQVTSSFPAKFTVTVNHDNHTAGIVDAAGSFCITLLRSDAPDALVNHFGYQSGRVTDKFAVFSTKADAAGNPYLSEHMVSRISCRIISRVAVGSYTLYIAEVTEAEVLDGGEVLTVNAFAARGKATPPAATVYREMVGGGFKCSVCGYVHESETLRDDFICPICRATADKFIQQE